MSFGAACERVLAGEELTPDEREAYGWWRATQESAAGADLEQLYASLEIPDLDNAIVRYFANATDPVGAIGPAHVQRAIDNVERHFDFVGHVDWFDYSMQRIAEVLGRSYRGGEAKNVSPGGSSRRIAEQFDTAFLDRITRHDRAFVDHVEAKWFADQPRS